MTGLQTWIVNVQLCEPWLLSILSLLGTNSVLNLSFEHNAWVEATLKLALLHLDTGQADGIVDGASMLLEEASFCTILMPVCEVCQVVVGIQAVPLSRYCSRLIQFLS